MIFAISNHPLSQFKHQLAVTDQWILSSIDQTAQGLLGYRLGQHGGNFLYVTGSQMEATVEWSFYQDFPLYQNLDCGILLTNDPRCHGTSLRADIIGIQIGRKHTRWHRMDWKPYLNANASQPVHTVLEQIRRKIGLNLNHCLEIAQKPEKIVFTGGLDSGLLAFMAHHEKQDFYTVINLSHQHRWQALPFFNLVYRKSGTISDRWGQSNDIRESYYDADMTDCITGFFGDTAMMHNHTLYHQCTDLYSDSVDLYDRNPPDPVPKFQHKIQAALAVVNIMRNTRFRHWFEEFRILDPYRDPDLTRLIMQLPWHELCQQFASGWIQKKFIYDMEPNWRDFLLKHKNEYL